MRGPTMRRAGLVIVRAFGEFGRLYSEYAYEVHNGKLDQRVKQPPPRVVTKTCAACICMHSTTVKCADER